MSKRIPLLALLAALTIGCISTPVEAGWWRGAGWDNGEWGGWRRGGPLRALHSFYPRFFSYPRVCSGFYCGPRIY
jgi:hypothetical protein